MVLKRGEIMFILVLFSEEGIKRLSVIYCFDVINITLNMFGTVSLDFLF